MPEQQNINQNISYYQKYLKYKTKYLELKKQYEINSVGGETYAQQNARLEREYRAKKADADAKARKSENERLLQEAKQREENAKKAEVRDRKILGETKCSWLSKSKICKTLDEINNVSRSEYPYNADQKKLRQDVIKKKKECGCELTLGDSREDRA